jgi:malate dehydrogenase (quinone)
MMSKIKAQSEVDVVLVGAGIMSATLAYLLHQLDPQLNIVMLERADAVASESSDAWNNAGTGHAGYCELNYTPQAANGEIQIQRALEINAAFEQSLEVWAHCVKQGILKTEAFIHATPHISFVWGERNVNFLRQRYQRLQQHHLFADMQYSEDKAELANWMPLVMQQSKHAQCAATRVAYGTDVDFGAISRGLVAYLEQQKNFQLLLQHQVQSLKQLANGHWQIKAKNRNQRRMLMLNSQFVFLGAGGAALSLLQKSAIPEAKGYGGFPVSGLWLASHNPDLIKQHEAKVYGKAAIGAPPMSVPHLDTRYIDGKPALLFGPFAGFTTKFLKQGSLLDLVKSVKSDNLKAILFAGLRNAKLTNYLIKEALKNKAQRMQSLREYFPAAKDADWKIVKAGQRVQIIKQCDHHGGKLEFGTEIVCAQDGSLAALLGASPGASTSVNAMVSIIQRCFPQMQTQQWQKKMRQMMPSYGTSLIDDQAMLKKVRKANLSTLGLDQ